MEGINVKSEKKIIYFLLATEPLTLRLFLNEFFISIKIIEKKISSKIALIIKSVCKFSSFNWTKLLSIKVKKVIKHAERVIKKINDINKFLFKKVNIN